MSLVSNMACALAILLLPSPAEAEPVLGFADHLFEAEEYYRSIGEYERYLFLCKDDCEKGAYAKLQIADAYRRGGAIDRAVELYSALTQAVPDSAEASEAAWLMSSALADDARHVEAARAYRRFAQAYPDDERAADARWEAVWSHIRARERGEAGTLIAALAPDDPFHDRATKLAGELGGVEDVSHRSPVLAGVLSGLLPGAGQAYVGRWRDGFNALLMNALWASAAVVSYVLGWNAAAIVLAVGELFWYGGNIVGAVTAAHRYNRIQVREFYLDLEDKYYANKEKAAATVPVFAIRF